MKEPDFYMITTINDFTDWSKMDKKTHGVVKTIEEARNIVDNNISDLHECRFGRLVIEGYIFGIPLTPKFEEWYSWEENEYNWVVIDKPEAFRGIVAFSL